MSDTLFIGKNMNYDFSLAIYYTLPFTLFVQLCNIFTCIHAFGGDPGPAKTFQFLQER
jgi:hypothetical protein